MRSVALFLKVLSKKNVTDKKLIFNSTNKHENFYICNTVDFIF